MHHLPGSIGFLHVIFDYCRKESNKTFIILTRLVQQDNLHIRAVPGQLEAPRKVIGPLFREGRGSTEGEVLVEPRSGETVPRHTNCAA